ncbi:MAG: hypothetical protein JO198_05040 [Candidatus Dormibacteraeota bacterium]|nr:hypothetical protein [Candidatus Dormibacteraeota bacterium]
MRRRQSRTAVLERDLSEAGSRAAETISDLAEHALAAARDAGHAASPALQQTAQSLSKALEKAADALAETGEQFARTGEKRAAVAAHIARERLADASEKFAGSIRPKKQSHRIRNLLIATAAIGGVVALVQSPLRGKITERLFGASPEDEPESIQLPGSESLAGAEAATPPADVTDAPDVAVEGNGVASAPSARETSQG